MSKSTYGHVLVLSSQRLECPAADDNFVVSKSTYGHVLVLPSQRLVHPAADEDFLICRKARMDMRLCYQVNA